jgi:hypothetical protein
MTYDELNAPERINRLLERHTLAAPAAPEALDNLATTTPGGSKSAHPLPSVLASLSGKSA